MRTITLITLGVKSTSDRTPNQIDIPETSPYFPIRSLVHNVLDGHLKAGGITTRGYAKQVVREVEKGSSGMVWAGGNAGLVGWAWYLSPQFVKVGRYFCSSHLCSCAVVLIYLQDMMVQSFVPVAAEMGKASNQKTR